MRWGRREGGRGDDESVSESVKRRLAGARDCGIEDEGKECQWTEWK